VTNDRAEHTPETADDKLSEYQAQKEGNRLLVHFEPTIPQQRGFD
jgi:hypothetical protein